MKVFKRSSPILLLLGHLSLGAFAQTGIITTIAGNGTVGFGGDGGQATAAQLTNPTGVALDSAGDLYIANPGSEGISVKLALVGQDGRVLDDSITMTLGPRQQIARYVWQELARVAFKGSLVLRGQAGAVFIAVALSERQGVLNDIPIIPGKFPGVPN